LVVPNDRDHRRLVVGLTLNERNEYPAVAIAPACSRRLVLEFLVFFVANPCSASVFSVYSVVTFLP
jgi:hypothetical protein